MLNWAVDRMLWMGVLCLVTWCATSLDTQHAFSNLRTVYFFNFPILFRAEVNRGYRTSGYGRTTLFISLCMCFLCGFLTPRLPYASTVWRYAKDVAMSCKMILMWASFCFMYPCEFKSLHSVSQCRHMRAVCPIVVAAQRPYSSDTMHYNVPYVAVFLPTFWGDGIFSFIFFKCLLSHISGRPLYFVVNRCY
jgi:hypothetical protein